MTMTMTTTTGPTSSKGLSSTDLGLVVVAEFHKKFGLAHPSKPTLPVEDVDTYLARFVDETSAIARRLKVEAAETKSQKLIRLQLIQEELSELGEGLLNHDEVECLDALVDLSYVVDGTYIAFGMDGLKVAGLLEVHRSNMSKLGPDGRPIIGASGRVEKGPDYTPPNLKGLFH
jgi:predicted HAD superfamily Cof-like phosphohydrolase